MISIGFKKLANTYGMRTELGTTFGEVQGYLMTFRDGMGTKEVSINLALDEAGIQKRKISEYLRTEQKRFLIRGFQFYKCVLTVTFQDTFGTLKRIESFLLEFTKELRFNEIKGSSACAVCGNDFYGLQGEIVLFNGNAAILHESCIDRLATSNPSSASNEKNESVLRGWIGAVLGAVVGAIPWAIVGFLGYMASIIGFVIGICIQKGYEWFGGKEGKAKLIAMLVLVVPSVFLGQYLAILFGLLKMTADGEMVKLTFLQLNQLIMYYLTQEPGAMGSFLGGGLAGLFFAYLGIFALARNLHKYNKETGVPKIQRIKQYKSE